jgi:glycogen synthase
VKIAFISREFPPDSHVGGIGTYTATAANLLAKRGHEVHVICLGIENRLTVNQNIHVHRIAMGKHPLPQASFFFLVRKFFREKLPNFLDAWTWAKTVQKYITETSVLGQIEKWEWPETNGEGAFLGKHLTPGRCICRIHTSWLAHSSHHLLESWGLVLLQRMACLKADAIVSPSSAMGQHYAKKVLRINRSIIASPNPLQFWNAPASCDSKSKWNWLFVGRIEYRKGIDLLVQSLKALPPIEKPVEMRIVGAWNPPNIPDDQGAQLAFHSLFSGEIKSVHSTGKPPSQFTIYLKNGIKIEYLGHCNHSEIYRHFDWAGLFIMPTRMDNYPYVLLEALSRGCCLMASDVGGVKEVCGKEPFANWIKPVNAETLTENMRKWVNSESPVEPLWQKAHAFAETHFGEEAGYQRLMDLYGREEFE